MGKGISEFLNVASDIVSIKKIETILPIARKTINVTPMVTGDDINLRTSLISPVSYDRELCKILLNHIEFVEEEDNKTVSYTDFVHNISNIDKLSAIWALYKSTYDNLSDNKELTCTNEQCKHKFKVCITMDELIHEDTYTIWDKVDDENNFIPFTQYKFPITIDYEDNVYEFNSKLPSIGDNNAMLSTISIDNLQYNLDNTGSVFSKPQHMALLVEAIRLSSKTNKFKTVETTNLNEILMAFQNYLPFKISDQFFKGYGEEFDKYVPKFYYNAECPVCKTKFKHDVDLELNLFRIALYK